MTTEYKNITGGPALQAFLNQLPAKIEANILRGAMRQGAKVILHEAQQNVPVASGDLRASLRVSTRSRRGVVIASVKAGSKKAWYAHIIEFTGAVPHSITPQKGKGKVALAFAGFLGAAVDHPGMRATPFMRPALDSQANAAVEAVAAHVRKRLTRQGLNTPEIEVSDA